MIMLEKLKMEENLKKEILKLKLKDLANRNLLTFPLSLSTEDDHHLTNSLIKTLKY
jgi:hypothetical protein